MSGSLQLEHDRQARDSRSRALGLAMPQPHRGECRFDGVGSANVSPVLRREVVESQKQIPILLQALHRGAVLGPEHCGEGLKRHVALGPRRRHPNRVQHALGLGLYALGAV